MEHDKYTFRVNVVLYTLILFRQNSLLKRTLQKVRYLLPLGRTSVLASDFYNLGVIME